MGSRASWGSRPRPALRAPALSRRASAARDAAVAVDEAADERRERAAAMNTATLYLKTQGKPITTPVSVIKEGSGVHNPTFTTIFAN